MKPEEAIEVLQLSKTCDFEGSTEDLEKAHQLGIEALKTVLDFRAKHPERAIALLPGETED